ncbi:MAG: hypothetical protein WBF13_07485 [Candidatus Zixiibacteriota bacterium]
MVRSTLWTARRGDVTVEIVHKRDYVSYVDVIAAIGVATFKERWGRSTPIKMVDQEDHVSETDALILVYVFRESSVRSQRYPETDPRRDHVPIFFLDNRTAG